MENENEKLTQETAEKDTAAVVSAENVSAENVSAGNVVSENVSPGKPEKKKYKRRFGDRKDGRRVRSVSPMQRVSAYIMKTRNTSSNFFEDEIDTAAIDRYVKEKKDAGRKGFNIMHVLIASYIRAASQLPGINRFISGREVYARNDIQICLVIKKEMRLEEPDTAIKVHFTPEVTAEEVYDAFTKVIEDYRNNPGGGFDKTAKALAFVPGFVLRAAVKLLHWFDYIGLLPTFLTEVSPFHGSFFITSMGSLGIPPIYHHLYDFGNVPIFMSFGAKEHRYELQADGTTAKKTFVRYTVVMDERICDGYYYATSLKLMNRYYKNPWLLDERPATVVEDVP